jgi:hypothetical protein
VSFREAIAKAIQQSSGAWTAKPKLSCSGEAGLECDEGGDGGHLFVPPGLGFQLVIRGEIVARAGATEDCFLREHLLVPIVE